ncbi:MAG: hypothetical protein U1F68_10765 [Gammaproteobacteria bacterium]
MDLVNVHLAFAITSVVSVGLVVSYLRAALGERFPGASRRQAGYFCT